MRTPDGYRTFHNDKASVVTRAHSLEQESQAEPAERKEDLSYTEMAKNEKKILMPQRAKKDS